MKIVWIGLGLIGMVAPPLRAILPAERSALIALYNSTSGDFWTNRSGWKTPPLHTDGFSMPGMEGTWHGVRIVNDQVIDINLGNNNLVGVIPVELGSLPYLRFLYLHMNRLSGSIPAELGDLVNLLWLYLFGNRLSGSIPPELGRLVNLQYLLLMENNLTGPIPAELGNLVNLFDLVLNDNQLSGSIPGELGQLSNLTRLSLSSNRLTGSIPVELGRMGRLQSLFLAYNRFSGRIPDALGDLAVLQSLDLTGNQLSGAIPVTLTNLTRLISGHTFFSYNALYSDHEGLTAFLNEKAPGWADSQTIAPLDVMAAPIGSTAIRVNWDAIPYSSDSGGYRVWLGTVSGGPYTFFRQTTSKTVTEIDVTGLVPGTIYYFVVSTRTDPHADQQNLLESEPSREVSATTLTTHRVTFLAGAGGRLSGLASQTVDHGGSTVEIEAVPDGGYTFAGWTGDFNGLENPLIIGNVTADMTVTASFIAHELEVIPLIPGWNWISFNVLPADRSLNSVFSGIQAQVEQVKTQTQSALRLNGQWLGDLANMDGIQMGKMYKVRVTAACTLSVSGSKITATTPIALVSGWNWVAFYPSILHPINQALSSITSQAQQAKSQTQSAIYQNGQWLGDLTQLEPGKGYTILMSGPGTLSFPQT